MLDPLSMLAPLTTQPGSDPSSAAETAEQFEALFVRTMLQQVRTTMDEAGLLSGGAHAQAFSGMLDEQLAQQIVESGGLGIAEQIQAQLEAEGTADAAPRPAGPVSPVRAGRISSGFGLRTDPLVGDLRHHDGMDIAAPVGTPVYAARAGTVRVAERRGGYGKVVIIDHGGGVETRYAHCDALKVREGQRVGAGTPIATVGDTGRSTGPHLHFEVRAGGRPVDPSSWIHLTP